MSPEIFREAAEVFDRVRQLPEAELIAAVDAACRGNQELRAQVMGLVEGDRLAGEAGFLEGGAVEDAARMITPEGTVMPPSGGVLGNYRLGRRIGAGGMGAVYEAQDLRLDRRVAVKILTPSATGADGEGELRFQREARAASRLNHPNIVSVYDAGVTDSCRYIVMEYVEGRTLRQIAASAETPDVQTILDWIAQAASALGAAHQAGIVHRDIKPENIMVRPDGFVKVLDFGLAKLKEPAGGTGSGAAFSTRGGQLAGTVRYLAPEQILGQAAGPQSDLFSLGVVAYELVTGTRPFDGPTDGAVFNAILNHTPPPPSAVRAHDVPELDALIMRAIEKDPQRRFLAAQELSSSCRNLSRAFVMKAPGDISQGQGRLMPRADSRRRRFAWLGAAGLAAAAVLASIIPMTRPTVSLRVKRITQITSGLATQRFVSDGTRLFYAAGNRDANMPMFQIATKGGDPIRMTPLTGMLPLDISPDRSELLLGQILKGAENEGTLDGPYPLWVADTLGNAPRRLGNIIASEARWSPKGDRLVFANQNSLWLAAADGSQPRMVAELRRTPSSLAWSPDGSAIRWTLGGDKLDLWEMDADGSHRRALFPEWTPGVGPGAAWTRDGKWFFFTAATHDGLDLWGIREGGGLFGRGPSAPQPLTAGPIKSSLPLADSGDHRLFFNGTLEDGELVRYDRNSDRWVPYLGGPPAMQVDHSPDGKWITYAHIPEGSIWRSRVDGTERMRLTAPPFTGCMNPRWSPDGRQIVFFGRRGGEQAHVYVAPAAGGPLQQVTNGEGGSVKEEDGSWSPDGNSIVFGATFGEESMELKRRLALAVVDVSSHRVTKLAGSEGLWSPRLSPDGRFVAALGFPNRIWLYDMKTGQASKLTDVGAGWPAWSRDGRFLYFQENPGQQLSRISVKDKRVEPVLKLSSIRIVMASFGWVGLAPDGTPISAQSSGGTQIYSLDWEER